MIPIARHIGTPSGSPIPIARTSSDWMTLESFGYQLGTIRVWVPPGFRFDLASIPRALWWLIAPFELSVTAPLVHDWLYSNPREGVSRRMADLAFAWIMEAEGVSMWRSVPAYWAVRLWGWRAWRQHRA